MKVEYYRDAKGEWRWRMKARNGRIVADGAEGYKRRIDCVRQYARIAGAIEAGTVKVAE